LSPRRRAAIVLPMRASQASPHSFTPIGGGALGRLLKDWRGRRGYSQLDLALAARTTQRHLSFIESGRAAPSRDMVLRLATTMALPLRQQNALLLAAGYAPAWGERDLSAPGLEVVNRALDYMLAQHEPFPAFVVDRCWNLLRANRGAARLVDFLTGPPPAEPASEPVNLAIAMMSPDGLRPLIANWQEVAVHFLRGVQSDAHSDGTQETLALLTRLLAFPDVASLTEVMPPGEGHPPVLPIHFRRGETSLRLFTTIATLGTPRDVTLEEVRIECFFPMDDAAEAICRAWAV
jgi:transcriptional regulator with XRE-family HTH domain